MYIYMLHIARFLYASMCIVGQNHICIYTVGIYYGVVLAIYILSGTPESYIYIYTVYIYGIFAYKITKDTVYIYIYIWFWPTLCDMYTYAYRIVHCEAQSCMQLPVLLDEAA